MEIVAPCKCAQGKTYSSGVTAFLFFFLPPWEEGTSGHWFCLLTFVLSVIFAEATSLFSLTSHNNKVTKVCVCVEACVLSGISCCCKGGTVINFSSLCFIVLLVVLRLLSCVFVYEY